MNKLKNGYNKMKLNGWGKVGLFYLSLLLIVLLAGICGLLDVYSCENLTEEYLQQQAGRIFIFEKMIESGFNALVVGFIVTTISNALNKSAEENKAILEKKKISGQKFQPTNILNKIKMR